MQIGQAGHALRLKRDATEVYRYPLGPRLLTMILRCVADNDVGSKRGAKHRLVRACKLFEEMLEAAEREREDREEEEEEDENSPSMSPRKTRIAPPRPPPAAFHALLLAASRANQSDLVARTYEEMVAAGISALAGVVRVRPRRRREGRPLADVALDVFASMRSDGFAARKSTYNSLLEACAKAPQPRAEQAFEIFNVMVAEGTIAPNARTFALLVEAAGASGSPALARDALASAEAAGVDGASRRATNLSSCRLRRGRARRPRGAPGDRKEGGAGADPCSRRGGARRVRRGRRGRGDGRHPRTSRGSGRTRSTTGSPGTR